MHHVHSFVSLNPPESSFSRHFLFAAFKPSASDWGAILGTVEADGKPVAGATVSLFELDRSSFSDPSGHFAFLSVLNGTYHFYVRIIGCPSATDRIQLAGGDGEAPFTLCESAIEAEEVVVSASPYAQPPDRSGNV